MATMRKALVLFSLAWLLAGCGALSSQVAPQPAPPQSFIWSDSSGVAFLTWTANQSGQITGTYDVSTAQGTQSLTLTGQQQQDANHIMLQIADSGEGMSGTINGNKMSTTSEAGVQTWYTGTVQQYSQIQAAYRAYGQMQRDLEAFQVVEETPPNNSAIGYYQSALQGAQNRVTDEQNALSYIQQQRDLLTLCSALTEFSANFPASDQDSELQLPFSQPGDQGPQTVVDRSDLSQGFTRLSNEAKQAAALPVPTIRGLSFPWRFDPGPQIAQGQQQLDALQAAVLAVAPQFAPLQQQAAQIQAQVAAMKQSNPC